MGTVLKCKCPDCGYAARLHIGGGLRDCLPEAALEIAHGSPLQPALTEALRQGSRFRIERFPAVCENCRKLHSGARVVWLPPEGEARVITSGCPDCGSRMNWYMRDAEIVRCPVCKKAVQLEVDGYWD